jgi:hypothetical protein
VDLSQTESTMSALGPRLIKAAKEARSIARGNTNPKTYRVHTPADIEVQAIRKCIVPLNAWPSRRAPRG